MSKKTNRYMPLLMALCVVIGIVIGSFYANHFSGNRLNIINSGSNRLNNLLHIIDDQYVDSVNINDLVEKAIPQILSELDPHSVYGISFLAIFYYKYSSFIWYLIQENIATYPTCSLGSIS